LDYKAYDKVGKRIMSIIMTRIDFLFVIGAHEEAVFLCKMYEKGKNHRKTACFMLINMTLKIYKHEISEYNKCKRIPLFGF